MRARSERRYAEDPLQPLYDAVEGHTGVPVGSFPRFIRTCHGQVVEVRSIDATWVENIYKEVICYGKQTIRWGQRIHPHPIIEWATRKFVLQKLQRVIAINPVQALLDAIPSLSLPETGGAIEFENAILKWIRVKVSEARASRRPELQEGVIAWATMCVDLELYGFGERLLVLLEDRTSTQRGRRDRVTMFDEFEGPYTPEELGRIDDALRNAPEVTSTHRALIGLCRDWGLRPIQIALLTADDVGADHGGPYVQVTSVKGKIRSRMRRNPGNFRKRYVTDATYLSLLEVIKHSRSKVSYWMDCIEREMNVTLDRALIHLPIFPMRRGAARLVTYLQDPSLYPYLMHSDSTHISRAIVDLSDILGVVVSSSSETCGLGVLALSASRFRATKGTSLALQGHDMAEVVEALDHHSATSVKHYFKMSRALEAKINSAANNSPEIVEAVATWEGRLINRRAASDLLGRGGRPVSNLGVCTKSDDCTYWPTRSCYGCSLFRPYREANHALALSHLEEDREMIKNQSTGSAASLLDHAIRGAQLIVLAIAEGNVQDGE